MGALAGHIPSKNFYLAKCHLPKITPSFQQFNSNSISPKIFPITNTNPSHTQLKKVNYITYRFKPKSSLNKVAIPPQQDLALFSEKIIYKVVLKKSFQINTWKYFLQRIHKNLKKMLENLQNKIIQALQSQLNKFFFGLSIHCHSHFCKFC